jgi:hypothetical protein
LRLKLQGDAQLSDWVLRLLRTLRPAFFFGRAKTNHRPGVVEKPGKSNSIPERLAQLKPVDYHWLVQGHEDESWEDKLEKDLPPGVLNVVYVRILAKEVAHFLVLLNVRCCGSFCRQVDIEKSSSEGRHECQSPEAVQGEMPPSVTRHE